VSNKKGKFRLLSYLIDDHLIYYKSANKGNKMFAFSLFQLSNYFPIGKSLQDFLKRGILFFYSVEINIYYPNKILHILCFKSEKKDEIFKNLNLIIHKLKKLDKSITFFRDNRLESEFLKILSLDKIKNPLITDISGSILVKKNSTITVLDFYIINNFELNDSSEAIYDFINYAISIKRTGYLIYNFRLIDNKVSTEIYYVDFSDNETLKISNFELEVNEFLKIDFINKFKLDLKQLFFPLWRYSLSNKQKPLGDISKVLHFKYYYDYKNLLTFNDKFKEMLKYNGIKFHQLNQNLFLVEKKTLVIILADKKFQFVLDIMKKYLSDYTILLIILNKKGYEEIIKMDNINKIPNLKVLDYDEFCKYDLKSLKNDR
jgi:hypothetical protein